jgi:hypothetical protein
MRLRVIVLIVLGLFFLSSLIEFDIPSHNHGNSDILLIKLDSLFSIKWIRFIGGSEVDEGKSIIQDNEENFVLAGYYNSVDFDFSKNRGFDDICVIKLDKTGNIIWNKTFGGSSTDKLWNLINTNDDHYLCTGYTWSPEYYPDKFVGGGDWITFMLDNKGDEIWSNYFGTLGRDYSSNVFQLSDNSILISGFIQFDNHFDNPEDTNVFINNADAMLMKLDNNGKLLWNKTYSGDWCDYIEIILELENHDLLVGGSTSSKSFDVSKPRELDAWVMLLNSNGSVKWMNTYGGIGSDKIRSILPISDNKILLFGTTSSGLGGEAEILGGEDIFAKCIDLKGSNNWTKVYGGNSTDVFKKALRVNKNLFVLAGTTFTNERKNEFQLIMIDSVGYEIGKKKYGGLDWDNLESISLTKDKGFILIGSSWSNEIN